MAHLRESVFQVIEAESDNHQSPSSSPFATADVFKEALVQELRSSPALTDRLSELILIGVKYHRAEMLEDHVDAHALLNHTQTWLDRPYSDARDRRRVIYFLIKLIGSVQAYPSTLYLHEVQLISREAFNGGGHSLVYKGTRKLGAHLEVVALKKPVIEGKKDTVKAVILKDFVREAIVWRQLNHPHVHPLLGLHSGVDGTGVSMTYAVSPYCSQTLEEFIVGKSRDKTDIGPYDPERDCVRLLGEIADGLAYLHSLKIVHCDIKPDNILISAKKRAHILDFGSNVIGETTPGKLTTPSLSTTITWQPPEGFHNSNKRPQSSYDVYSFACLCYSICMGYPNIFNYKRGDIIPYFILTISRGERPKWEEAMSLPIKPGTGLRPSESLWNVVINPGWNQDPLSRPNMKVILDYFVRERRQILGEDHQSEV